MYQNSFIENLKKIELKKNNKTPATKWSDPTNQIKYVDLKKYNVGFPTGKINNIVVLDIDFKDNGIEEFNKYIEQYGKINTFIVKTPNKGFHYYFLYENLNEATQHLINECLTNKTKYRNRGLDIRTKGGYIVAPNSSLNNIFYEIINDVKPIELPENLAIWLLQDNEDDEENDEENDEDDEENDEDDGDIDDKVDKGNKDNLINKDNKDNVDKKIINKKNPSIKITKNTNTISKTKKTLPKTKKTLSKTKETLPKTKRIPDTKYVVNKYKYEITDEELITLLNKLDKTYLENYTKWLIVLTICRNLDKWEIFDSWCRKCPKNYNYDKNLKMWNVNKGLINVNYLIKKINEENKLNIKLAERYIPIDNKSNTEIEKIFINIEKFKISETMLNNEVLIIESDTGTGKTTHIAEQIKAYIDKNEKYNKYQLFSIVNLINLSNQQIKTANDKGIVLVSYKDNKKNFRKDNIVICINSLIILKYMDEEYFKNKILFLDEINDLLNGLTHNNLLIPNIKIIYEILVKFVKFAHKIIVSDASIKQNVIDFLNKYRKKETMKIIINQHLKYKNINAIRVKDENLFLNKLLDRIKSNKYFLFGCDSCSTITKLYNICIEKNKDKADKFILITSETEFILINASEQFKDKWVFYSPSIMTGVDFSIEEKQDHFIYAKGESISPDSIYQQSTRNRNIDNLYYYFNSKQNYYTYQSLNYTKSYYKELMNANDALNGVCRQLNENDESCIIQNQFYELFCYNEYIKDCYNTNKRIHYEQILKNKGFILKTEGEDKKLSKENKKEIKAIMLNIDIIEQYLKDEKENKDFDYKYENLRNLITYFNLKDEELQTYSGILTNKFEREHYFNFIKLLKSDEKTMLKTTGKDNVGYEITQINTIENKINIIKKIYDKHKIKYMSLDNFNEVDKINITDEEYKIIKHIFRSKKEKPVNGKELQKILLTMLRHIISYIDIIVVKRTMNKDKKNIYLIDWNINKINYYLNLYKKKLSVNKLINF